MTNILVRIFLHGLIAFVPQAPGHLTALLVDARDVGKLAPIASRCVVNHTPTIEVQAPGDKCFQAGCDNINGSCQCDLDRLGISILPETQPQTPPSFPSGSVAEFPAALADETFAYVAKFPTGFTVDSQLLGGSPPAKLAARMSLSFDNLSSCKLALREDDNKIHSLSFHPLGGGALGSRQAMAQMLVLKQSMPLDSANPITLRLQSLDDSSIIHDLPLLPIPCSKGSTDQCIDISLSNERPILPDVHDPCNDGVARDFALLYELTPNPPLWEQRPVPQIETSTADVDPLKVPDCEHVHRDPESRPICPMGSFN
jgi:hypothetical protein